MSNTTKKEYIAATDIIIPPLLKSSQLFNNENNQQQHTTKKHRLSTSKHLISGIDAVPLQDLYKVSNNWNMSVALAQSSCDNIFPLTLDLVESIAPLFRLSQKTSDKIKNITNIQKKQFKNSIDNGFTTFVRCTDQTCQINWKQIENPSRAFKVVEDKDSFRSGGELGRGSYGVVKKVTHINTGQTFAIKSIPKSSIYEACITGQVENEIKVQLQLNHLNVLRCYACVDDIKCIHLFMECCSEGDLYGRVRLRPQRRLPEEEAFFYFMQLVNGLHYIHSKGYCHRDLKLENLLLASNSVLKIADFGWVAPIIGQKGNFNFCGTLDYLAPEMIRGNGHDWRVDIWASGVLLYEMLVGKPPFQATRHYELITNILNQKYCRPKWLAADVLELIDGFLQEDLNKRLTLRDCLKSPWVQRMWRNLCGKILQYQLVLSTMIRTKSKSNLKRRHLKDNVKLLSPSYPDETNHYDDHEENDSNDTLLKTKQISTLNQEPNYAQSTLTTNTSTLPESSPNINIKNNNLSFINHSLVSDEDKKLTQIIHREPEVQTYLNTEIEAQQISNTSDCQTESLLLQSTIMKILQQEEESKKKSLKIIRNPPYTIGIPILSTNLSGIYKNELSKNANKKHLNCRHNISFNNYKKSQEYDKKNVSQHKKKKKKNTVDILSSQENEQKNQGDDALNRRLLTNKLNHPKYDLSDIDKKVKSSTHSRILYPTQHNKGIKSVLQKNKISTSFRLHNADMTNNKSKIKTRKNLFIITKVIRSNTFKTPLQRFSKPGLYSIRQRHYFNYSNQFQKSRNIMNQKHFLRYIRKNRNFLSEKKVILKNAAHQSLQRNRDEQFHYAPVNTSLSTFSPPPQPSSFIPPRIQKDNEPTKSEQLSYLEKTKHHVMDTHGLKKRSLMPSKVKDSQQSKTENQSSHCNTEHSTTKTGVNQPNDVFNNTYENRRLDDNQKTISTVKDDHNNGEQRNIDSTISNEITHKISKKRKESLLQNTEKKKKDITKKKNKKNLKNNEENDDVLNNTTSSNLNISPVVKDLEECTNAFKRNSFERLKASQIQENTHNDNDTCLTVQSVRSTNISCNEQQTDDSTSSPMMTCNEEQESDSKNCYLDNNTQISKTVLNSNSKDQKNNKEEMERCYPKLKISPARSNSMVVSSVDKCCLPLHHDETIQSLYCSLIRTPVKNNSSKDFSSATPIKYQIFDTSQHESDKNSLLYGLSSGSVEEPYLMKHTHYSALNVNLPLSKSRQINSSTAFPSSSSSSVETNLTINMKNYSKGRTRSFPRLSFNLGSHPPHKKHSTDLSFFRQKSLPIDKEQTHPLKLFANPFLFSEESSARSQLDLRTSSTKATTPTSQMKKNYE